MLKKFVRNMVSWAVRLPGILYVLENIFTGKGVYILMYHELTDKCGFEKQMKYFQGKYSLISLDEAVDILKGGKKPGRDYMVITFDDGYRDNYEAGVEVFMKYKLRPAIFITSGYIGCFSCQPAGKPMLDWAHVKLLAESCADIGAHTVTHPKLNSLELNDIRFELGYSKRLIEEKINKKVVHFAYPYGLYNQKVKEEAKRIFDSAVTVIPGVNYQGCDLHELKRIGMTPEMNLTETRLRILKNKIKSYFGRRFY